ncbi:MAG: NUDIX domain-containing protein [Candidatus Nanohaloarchaea archaeon]|nr:NUDIX domain-containing protein [Candidatus Nanohaloarchaea archaeon]
MREEERVCVVLYKVVDGSPRYAVLRRTLNWDGWELVKGRMEGTPEETARIEVAEEAGIDELASVEPVDHELEWTFEEDGEEVHVTCHCFAAEAAPDARVTVVDNPDDEHEHGYFLNYRDARDILTYDDQRELLEAVHEQVTAA